MAESFSGRELGRRILASLRTYVARALSELSMRVDALQKAVEDRPKVDELRNEWRADFDAAIARMPVAQSVAREDVRAMLEGMSGKWQLEFERFATAQLQRVIDQFRQPEDGEDGKDGGSVEDFDIDIDGRTLTITMKIGERIEKRTKRFDIPIYRDVYQSGKEYERCDMVTFAGSMFIAMRDATAKDKPEQSAVWKMCVKRGRDGKDLTEAVE